MSDYRDAKYREVIFITEDDIKVKTPMSGNKADSTLINFITLAQDMYIKKNLGSELYEKLFNEWVNASFVASQLPDGSYIDPISTPNAIPPVIAGDKTNYVRLYEEIRLPLIWYAYLLALPNIAISVEESGLNISKGSEYSENGGIVGLRTLRSETKGIAQSYMMDLIKYIDETFKCEEVEGKVKSGSASIGIYFARKAHHGYRGNRY